MTFSAFEYEHVRGTVSGNRGAIYRIYMQRVAQ